MNNRKIIKGHQRLISSAFNVDKSTDKFQNGIIYTLYSDELNSIKVGFVENERVLENKLSSDANLIGMGKREKGKSIFISKYFKRTWF